MKDQNDKLKYFVEIVRKLRSENGCPWDREQSPESLKPYLLEETRELIEAIDSHDSNHIKEELGDVLYIIVLLAQMHHEEKLFNIDDVIDTISEKMVRRHSHVFSNEQVRSVAEHRKKWLEIKKKEKSSGIDSKKN